MSTTQLPVPPANHVDLVLRAHARLILNRKEEEIARARQQESSTSTQELQAKVRDATRNAWHWLRNYTCTENEHWLQEGRTSPYEPFPDKPYFEAVLDVLAAEPIVFIEKSRDLMMSWLCVGYLTLEAMKVPARKVIFQTMKESKAEELVNYAKTLWKHQPDWLRDAHPLAKPVERQSAVELEFANGSKILGIAAGGDQIRSFHPYAVLIDEAAFLPQAGESYNAAIATAPKIILNSSAGPGWFGDTVRDIGTI